MKDSPPVATPTLPQLLDRYRTLTSVVEDFVPHQLILLTHHSAALDGASLTLPQTLALIQQDVLVSNKPQADHGVIIDCHQALQMAMRTASRKEFLNRALLHQLAATLMRQTGGPIPTLLSSFDSAKGELRPDGVSVGSHVRVSADKLPAALDQLIKEVNTRMAQVKTIRQMYNLSFQVHFDLLTLQPFGAGNGRLARLVMSYIQQYHGLPLSQVYADCRTQYVAALRASWREQTPVKIVDFMHGQLNQLLQEGITQWPCREGLA